jgi:hypothetical protein
MMKKRTERTCSTHEEDDNYVQISVGKHKGNISRWRPKSRWESKSTLDFKGKSFEGFNCIQLAHNRIHCCF